jgi:predicted permease
MARFFRRLTYLFRRADPLREELESHRAMLEQQHLDDGATPAEARFAAQRQMGNATRALEDSRGVWLAPWLESVWQDLGYAARNLRRQPGFTIPALAALALGIGLNTSLFTVLNGVALRPWPVRDPTSVVRLLKAIPGRQTGFGGFSVAEFQYFRAHSRALSGVMLDREEAVRLDGQTTGRPSAVLFVSGNYFPVLGVAMELGRGLTDADDNMAAPAPVAVLSYYSWRTRYGGDRQILGREIRLDEVPFTVIGVTAEEFTSTNPSPQPGAWVPLSSLLLVRPNDADVKAFFNSDYCCSAVEGRMAPGVSRSQAQAELSALSTQFRANLSKTESDRKPQRVVAVGTSFFAQPNRKSQASAMFTLMFVAVGLVLLLACANVGNLLLARSAARRKEIASRLALGASRGRLVRQLLTESLLLGLAAAGLALALAYILPGVVLRSMAAAPSLRLEPDRMVLGFSLGLGVLSSVLFGLAPALRATRLSVNEVLKQHSAGGGSRLWFRDALAAVQVAISIALLIGAGLMLRGVQAAQTADLGFRTDVDLVTIDLPANAYDSVRARVAIASLTENLRPLAEQGLIAGCGFAPLSNRRGVTGVYFQGQTPDQAVPMAVQFVSVGYFEVLGMPIVEGRGFTVEDGARKNIIANKSMAERYWPGESPIGKAIFNGPDRREIVGVVRDAQLTEIGPIAPMFFWPFSGDQSATLLIRDRAGISPRDLMAAVAAVEPRAIVNVVRMPEQVERWLGPSRTASAIAASLGGLALTLAAIGVFGVLAYSVEQRRREIGVRMALGAHPSQVVALVLRVNALAMGGGVAGGLVLSGLTSRLLSGFLYGVSRLDLAAYGGVLLILLAAGFAAAIVPAHRATKVDPVVALRYD